jgi:hypothetical protein
VFELAQSAFIEIRELFTAPYLALPINGIIAGNSPGRIWVDERTSPTVACVWDRRHGLYFGGNAHHANLRKDLYALIQRTILPDALAHGIALFKLYYSTDDWKPALEDCFGTASLTLRERLLFTFEDRSARVAPVVPTGVSLQPIDRRLLSRRELKNLDAVLEEINACRTTTERFLTHGFGFCLLVKDAEIACWCTAEYVYGQACGIGIETVEHYMGEGYATLAATAFIDRCRANDIEPHWDSWASNLSSIAVAKKVGFQNSLSYTVMLCDLRQK